MILCQPCLYFALEVKALTLTSSSQAGLISATVPLLTSIAAWFTLKEKLGPRFVAGLVVSLIGVVWLTLGNAPRFDGGNPVLGNSLEFGAMIADTVSMIIVKKLSSRYNPFTLTAMQVLGGLVFFLPGVWGIAHTPIRAWSADLLLIIMGLGAFVTLGAFGLYNWGMSRITASRASAFIYLTPVTAVIVGWFFLNETLTTGQCMAACVVIAGVMLSESFPRGKKAGR
jgi:drug/metabolite transporter (DMT)-like permease